MMKQSAVFTSLVLVACSEPAAEPPAQLVATVVAALAGDPSASLTGDVRARFDSNLGFRVGGQIVDRPVRRGQLVRRGQVLARIDAADLSLGAEQARAQASASEREVAAAQAASVRAAADERRLAPLVGAGGIAPQQLDATRAAAASAAADLSAARARLTASRATAAQAGNQQRYATLVADADGVVADLLAEPGQVVAAGQPVVRLARSGGRDAVVAVPETLRASLPNAATAEFVGGGTVAAVLRELSAAADPRTRSFEARYALAAADVPVGTTVTLRFMPAGTGQGAAALSVPLSALIDRGRGPGVWVVRAGVARFRPVRLAGVEGETARIAGGIRRGERIVGLGAHLITEGQKVRVGPMPR